MSELKEEVFIGARELGNEIYKIMPTYKLLLDQLQEVMQRAKSFSRYDNSINPINLDRRDFNNTIGIFGARGTGKSSALYTIQKELSKSKYNIILPIIEPDNFGDNTKIIGSIVGFLCKEGKNLLNQLEVKNSSEAILLAGYYKNGILKPNNRLQSLIYETIEYHLYTEKHYRELLGANYEDLANHIKKSERLLIPDIEFKKKLNDLIEEIIIVTTALNINDKNNDFKEYKVMLYIFIDDIDLKTSKTRELVHALLQYTNHPNVVTILSGDYDILHSSLTFALLADEPLNLIGLKASDFMQDVLKNKNEIKISESKSELAHQYLKKIIPPARRHQLVKWNENTIPKFTFGKSTLLDQISKLLDVDSPFSYVDENGNLMPIKLGYSIFDEHPRGIINVYYHLSQLVNAFNKKEENKESIDEQDKFRMVKSFIDTIISSNNKFLEHQETIFDLFLSWGDSAENSFIDYSKTIDLDIELIVIADMIRWFLDINFNIEEFKKVQLRVVEILATGIGDRALALKEKNKILEDSKKSYKNFDRYELIKGIGLTLNITDLFFLYELLLQFQKGYYYEATARELNDEKDRFVIMVINKLFCKNPSIAKELLIQSRILKQSDVKKSIILLQDLCMPNAEYMKTKQIYKELLKNIRYIFDSESKSMREIEIRKDLFINTLTMIRKSDDEAIRRIQNLYNKSQNNFINGKVSEKKQKKFILIELLENMIESVFIAKNEYEGEALRIFEKELEKFSINIRSRIFSREKFIVVIPNYNLNINAFFNGQDGVTKTTMYDEARNSIFHILTKNTGITRYNPYRDKTKLSIKSFEVEFGDYLKMINCLYKLHRNNKVWYGQKEAFALLEFLKNEAYIKFEYDELNDEDKMNIFFIDRQLLALRYYYKYVSGTKNFLEDLDYDDAKKSIKDKIDDEYEKLKDLTAAELRQYQLNLEYLEDDYSEGVADV